MCNQFNRKEMHMSQNSAQQDTFSIKPIGFIRASDAEGSYVIEVLPPYVDALRQLEKFSHVVILWWADRHDNAADRNRLTTELPYAPGARAGVFACRSEYRPNPIAMTIMPILAIDHASGFVVLPWVDAFDGTPVLDLKPYVPSSDRIRDVKAADWMAEWPQWMEEAGEYFAAHPTLFG
jgi:tRNA-Thr(GGU) m(6)t(6)A37 methyltransferase TsaA